MLRIAYLRAAACSQPGTAQGEQAAYNACTDGHTAKMCLHNNLMMHTFPTTPLTKGTGVRMHAVQQQPSNKPSR